MRLAGSPGLAQAMAVDHVKTTGSQLPPVPITSHQPITSHHITSPHITVHHSTAHYPPQEAKGPFQLSEGVKKQFRVVPRYGYYGAKAHIHHALPITH